MKNNKTEKGAQILKGLFRKKQRYMEEKGHKGEWDIDKEINEKENTYE